MLGGKFKLCRRNAEKGSVLAELAITLPLLLIFLAGLAEVGRLISQITWLSQTTYSAALKGSELPLGSGALVVDGQVKTFADNLNSLQNRGAVLWDINKVVTTFETSDPAIPTQTDIVRVKIDGSVKRLFAGIIPITLNFHTNVAAPYFLSGNLQNIQGTGTQNPIDSNGIVDLQTEGELDMCLMDVQYCSSTASGTVSNVANLADIYAPGPIILE